jgi:acyl-CoA synthetase (AMP-forming)/AMP-acid ligase II
MQFRSAAAAVVTHQEMGMIAKTPLDALYRNAQELPENTALQVGRERWTNRRFLAGVERVARGMWAHGVRPGDRVVLHMPNCAEIALAYFACFRIGAIAAPLNVRYKPTEIRAMLERLAPTLYIGDASLYARVAPLGSEILGLGARYVVGFPTGAGPRSWDDLLTGNGSAPPREFPDVNSVAVLLVTSGTTGAPKFVAHTHATLAAVTEAFQCMGFEGSDAGAARPILLNSVPMVHASGFATLLAGFWYAAPAVVIRSFEPDVVLDAIETYECNWMAGLPFMFVQMIQSQHLRPRKVDSLRFCCSSGDVCPVSVQREFAELFGVSLHSVWASSEVLGSLVHGLQPGPVSRCRVASEVSLVDETGRPVARGEVGELRVRGPNLFVGYWSAPGAIDPARFDGWFNTGDLMRQGDDAELWFVARKKDLIIRGGSNISPLEIERVLLSHPAVHDAAAVGIPDGELGERVAAAVSTGESGGKAMLENILALVREHLADYKVPEWLQIVAEIPRNAQGKIDRGSVRSMIMDGMLRESNSSKSVFSV